ncbi:MAG: DMT family transporter [Pseudonocardia sp.]|uniref:DMT family transporter n=1 Tax=unclassified Pseudonocardia TaxID=2619320 RepID=UPI00086C5A2E|nr:MULTISPECIES: DMT family transporter [unclassified Pseudonocardia]MBN9107672.1 DMT family transporter [Pseudonocardia sp.]ODU24749.1 MAG: hypothetical protein ABS80_11525 [Pseudonocardia sp. SCN 72-51]ODV08498.1 MAG: hypothetical protein ABT15_04430 [Pseudonocardia sp. SCN 73-27]
MLLLAIGFALLAALLFAVAWVAQQRAASAVPDEQARGLRLILRLVRSPLWWAGFVGDVGGFLAQAAALAFGSLLLVQPLIVTSLLFALPLGARFAGRVLRRSDLGWAAVLTVALAAFVVVGDPTEGSPTAPTGHWVPTGAVLVGLLVVCVVAAGRRRGTARALLLAVATAIAYGVLAAATKAVVALLEHGIGPALTGWETYLLVVAAVGGTLLQQSAFQAGDLAASIPAVTVGEPVVAAIVGVTVLDERIAAAGPGRLLVGVLVVVMAAATIALARSSARATTDTSAAVS